MSENNPETQVQQREATPELIPDLSFLTTLPGASHTEAELQQLEQYSKQRTAEPSGGSEANTEAKPEAGTPPAGGQPENTEKAPEATTEVQAPEVFAKLLEDSEADSAVKPKDVKEIMGVFKNKYQIDLESAEGLSALQQKYDELLEKSGSTEKATQELEKYRAHLLSLPEPIKQAIIAAENGQDFATAYDMAMGRIVDFSKPWEGHKDVYEITKKMLPNLNLTKAEFEDDPEDPRVQDAIELAKEKYAIKQQENNLRVKDEQAKQEEGLRKIKGSIERAFSHAANVFKNAESQDLKKIQTILADGRFDDLFFDDNGFREDAIEKLVYAEYAPKMIQEQTKVINSLRQQLRSLSNQIAEANGKSPDVTGSVASAKGLGAPVLPDVKTPEVENKSLDSYNEYIESKRRTRY